MRESDRIGELLPSRIDALLVAGGQRPKRNLIMPAALRSRHIIAIDGGLRHLRFFDLKPEVVIGDFDSAQPQDITWARRRRAHVVLRSDQDHSDMDKALLHCMTKKWKHIVIAGADGSRADHFLHGISRISLNNNLTVSFLFQQAIGRTLTGREEIELPIGRGKIFSWIGLLSASGASLSGCNWPFKSCNLEFGKFQSLSNVAAETNVTFSQKSGKSLIIIPIGKV